ncbi:MAG: penicillin acylase family protein [Zetaproteobacteria bacterium]|nr:penicillin acylase family protein [Zetaproteobacteria bacterium]
MYVFCGWWVVLLLSGCSVLTTYPDHYSQLERLQQFRQDGAPLQHEVRVYWNEYAVPFIEAQSDTDLAFAIGAVHAHLRIDQLELLRLVSQGRLSSVAGPIPVVKQMDHGLRMLDFMGSAKRSLDKLNPATKQWMQQFTAGLNWYLEGLQVTPVTNRIFDQPLRPYDPVEVMAISRLVAADLTWITYLKYLRYAEKKDWQEVFLRSLREWQTDSASYDNPKDAGLSEVIRRLSKSGSNSIAFVGRRTHSGAAMIANDPHVGLSLPNFWLLMGMKSPSYHAVGLMIPGVPIIGVGRNPHIAWGGTNMRAISSHLYDVASLPSEQAVTKTIPLRRRWWPDTTLTIRETPFGPILSDLDFLAQKEQAPQVALNWVGKEGGTELQGFLEVAQARNWQEFKSAFTSYHVSAMNMLYADTQGNIGMVAAYGQPVLQQPEKTLDLVKSIQNPIAAVLSPAYHPNPYNPPQGYLASANNKPFVSPEIPFSYGYAIEDRIERLKQLAASQDKFTLQDLKSLQSDVFSQQAWDLKQQLLLAIAADADLMGRKEIQYLQHWDGRFQQHSRAAVLFYAWGYFFWQEYLGTLEKDSLERKELLQHENWKVLLRQWLRQQDNAKVIAWMRELLPRIQAVVQEYPTWGEFTVQPLAPLLGRLPWIGARFRLSSVPVSGSNGTLHKYGRKFSIEREEVSYGASARHISDLSSLDANYFILNGGQDSWLMNENLADQAELWQAGKYLQIPLSLEKVRQQFTLPPTLLVPRAKSPS